MPDQEITQLSLLTESQISGDNLFPFEDDPAGVPDTRKVNWASILGGFYKIVPSVASNNLTVAITHLDGSSPSTTNPLGFKIGDVWKLATGTLSVTKNANTNWCNAGSASMAANPIDFFVYVLNETGASAGIKVLFSRIPAARTMADFVNTSTSEKYPAGSWTNFNATDQVTNIGRFRAQLSAAASHNWSIVTSVVIARPTFETDWLNWSPVHTGFTATVPSGGAIRYRLSGNLLTIAYNPLTPGVSNLNDYQISTPFTAKNIANYYQYSTTGWTHDNSVDVANGIIWVPPNGTTIVCRRSALATWTTSNNKIVTFSFTFEIE